MDPRHHHHDEAFLLDDLADVAAARTDGRGAVGIGIGVQALAGLTRPAACEAGANLVAPGERQQARVLGILPSAGSDRGRVSPAAASSRPRTRGPRCRRRPHRQDLPTSPGDPAHHRACVAACTAEASPCRPPRLRHRQLRCFRVPSLLRQHRRQRQRQQAERGHDRRDHSHADLRTETSAIISCTETPRVAPTFRRADTSDSRIRGTRVAFLPAVERHADRPRAREHILVLDRCVIAHVIPAERRIAFDDVQRVAVEVPRAIEPGLIREVHDVNDERVARPSAPASRP